MKSAEQLQAREEYQKVYREKHRERLLAESRAYWQANKIELNAKGRAYRNCPEIKERDHQASKIRRRTPEYKAKKKAWDQANRAKVYGWHEARHAIRIVTDPVYRIRKLVMAAQNRARKKGESVEAGLLQALILNGIPRVCPCCGAEFDHVTVTRVRGKQPSLDRFDSTKGYTIANVKVICCRCNSLKNASKVEDLKNILAYMERGA